MSKHKGIALEKEKLKAQITRYEYRIQKDVLKLKKEYHPVRFASGMAANLLSGNTSSEDLLLAGVSKKRKKKAKKEGRKINGIQDFMLNFFMMVEAYFSSTTDGFLRQMIDEEEEYVIGEDDIIGI